MASNTVWGLDIGNSAIKAVKMVKEGGNCKIVAFDIIDIPHGENDTDRSTRLQSAMGTLITNNKFGNDPVYVSVTGNICLYKEFQLPPGSEDKLRDLVQYEVKQQIPFPLEQVEWGFERYEDPNGVGVALIAVRKTDIQDLITQVNKCKLNVRGITPGPIALFNFVHYEFNPQGTTLILDSGAKGTDFVVMNKRQIYFRTIPIAGKDITGVLEKKFKVSYEKAEDLKKNISKSPQADKILTVIEPTLRQLGGEVQRTMGFYKAKARNNKIAQCYLLGHTFRLPKMAETLQSQVREAPFSLVEGLQRIGLDRSIAADVWANEFPTMAVAMGLGLQGLGLSELTLNLIPQEVKTTQAVDTWKPWAAASVAIILITLFLSHRKSAEAHGALLAQTEQLAKAETDAQRYQKDEAAAVQGIDVPEARALRWSRVGHDRGKITNAFAKLSALKGENGGDFFGQTNKIFLTNLYVSRMPMGTPGALVDTGTLATLGTKEHLSGARSVYASLAKVNKDGVEVDTADLMSEPRELRADVPMVVIMTGEIEEAGALQTLPKLSDTLKKLPEVVGEVRIERVPEGPTYSDAALEYSWDGNIKASPTGAAVVADPSKEKKTKYVVFHAVLRWNDTTDKDIEPTAAAPKATKPAAAPARR